MSLLKEANYQFREKNYLRALDLYREFLKSSSEYPEVLLEYSREQIIDIERREFKKYSFSYPNVVLTACNAKYFPALVKMIRSLMSTSYDVVDEVHIFDFGLHDWQKTFFTRIAKISLFSAKESILKRPELQRFKIDDPLTYFFKVYALHFWQEDKIESKKHPQNCLWIDSGIEVAKSLDSVFQIIEEDGYFFVDHSDVCTYYSDPQDRLVNILSPCLFESSLPLHVPIGNQLLRPYIKANFFGIQFGGPFQNLLNEHYKICCQTEVLYEPRNISNNLSQQHWIKNSNVLELIKQKKINNTGKYVNGRHEQTVWSYLAAVNDLKIRDTRPYNYTCAPGSGWLHKENWKTIMRPKLRKNLDSFRSGMEEFVEEHDPEAAARLSMITAEELIELYLQVSHRVYFEKKKFMSAGFPIVAPAKKSVVRLTRGSTSRTDEYKYAGELLRTAKNVREEIFVLMGNGPSLSEIDFQDLKEFDTFGLNAAYRAYPRLDFWPKYFGCFDALVCGHHAPEFKRLIKDSPIEKFFFINFDDAKKQIFPESEIQNHPKFQRIDFRYRTDEEKKRNDILAASFTPFMDMRTSGTNTIQCALLMGYRKILLLGCDANYVEYVDGAAKINNNPLKIKMDKTPEKNPNYWFDDYQQRGDVFNKPNLQISQLPAWNKLASTLQHLKIPAAIYNCSLESNIACFPKLDLISALELLKQKTAESLETFKCK
jgi:hypothetical protein